MLTSSHAAVEQVPIGVALTLANVEVMLYLFLLKRRKLLKSHGSLATKIGNLMNAEFFPPQGHYQMPSTPLVFMAHRRKPNQGICPLWFVNCDAGFCKLAKVVGHSSLLSVIPLRGKV